MSFWGSSARGTCPACGWADVRRSHTPERFDRLLKMIGLLPYRCERCGNRFYARARPQVCPQCRTVNTNRLGWCEACGVRLPPEKGLQRWEDVLVPYIVVAVLIGVILSVVLFLAR
jgi:hypothetical protein